MRAAGIPESPSYVFDHDAPPAWSGPVIRRDPATYQRPSQLLTWRCANVHCREWTMPHAFEPDRCNFCGTTRAAA